MSLRKITQDVLIGKNVVLNDFINLYGCQIGDETKIGAFVEILPGKEGMVHISELANYRVANIEDEVKLGDEITVIVIKNDEGKIGLSRRALLEKPSQIPGSKEQDSLSPDYPFRTQRATRPPQHPRPPLNKQRH